MIQLTDAQAQEMFAAFSKFIVYLEPPPVSASVNVPAGANLQAAIDAAAPGSTLLVTPGAFAAITITKPLTLKSTGTVPARQIVASDDPAQFVRISATGVPAVTMTAPATLIGFYCTRTDANPPIVSINGDWTVGRAQLFNCWVPAGLAGSRRGVEANGCATFISQSRIENCWFAGQDAQAVSSWTGPGPLTIDDCYLEGSTQAVMIGGDDAIDQAHQPKNFTLTNSRLSKQLAWRSKTGLVKTGLEIKNCVGFLIQNNTIEYAWVDGQIGFLVQLTPRNQDGGNPWASVQNGVIQNNVFQHGAGGVNILGTDNDHPSGRTMNVRFSHNRCVDIDGKAWGANGRMIQMTGGPDSVTFDHNTFSGANLNTFLALGDSGEPVNATRFVFTNNIVIEGDYGISGDNTGQGVPALSTYTPGYVVSCNAIQKVATSDGEVRTIQYPPTNVVYGIGIPVNPAQPTTDGVPIGA